MSRVIPPPRDGENARIARNVARELYRTAVGLCPPRTVPALGEEYPWVKEECEPPWDKARHD